VNLLPTPPAGRRYFTLGLILILLWLVHFAGFAYWLFQEQSRVESQVAAETQALRDRQAEARTTVAEHQAFMDEHGPVIRFRDAVDALREGRLIWQEGLNTLYGTLPTESTLIRVEATGPRLDGWATVTSASEAAVFLDALQEQDPVQEVGLHCLGRSCEGVPPLTESDREQQVLHFHLVLRQVSPQSDGEGGENDGS
jgi:cell division protein FtsB